MGIGQNPIRPPNVVIDHFRLLLQKSRPRVLLVLDDLRQTCRLPVEQIVTTIFTAVQQFSAGNQSDDLTLVVARAR